MFRSMYFGAGILAAMGAPIGPTMARPWMTPAKSAFRSINRLNRAERWRAAKSYTHARSLSPHPERPVR